MENYFNYFTEIEEHFQRRRGTGLLLSTLDWALIETWKDAGIPLEAALRGIDSTFDAYERRPSKTRKVNSLAYCSQEVLAAAEDMKEAAVGASRHKAETPGLESADIEKRPPFPQHRRLISPATMQQYFAERLAATRIDPGKSTPTAKCLPHLVDLPLRLEDLERHLTILEERLLAALTIGAPEAELLKIRTEADREIAPYRSKMPAAQIEQLLKQFVHKRLFEEFKIPRLSLFYL